MAVTSSRLPSRAPRSRPGRRRRWALALGVYVAGLSAVLGVLAEQRWGWLPVRARTTAASDDIPVPRGAVGMTSGGMSSRWSEDQVARGWAAGGLHAGYFPAPASPDEDPASPAGATWLPSPDRPEAPDALGPGLSDLKVLNLAPPDFTKLKGK